MNITNIGRLLLSVTVVASLGTGAAHAANSRSTETKTSAPVKITALEPAVRVKLGEAMLEEYHGGDPDSRTLIYRSGEAATATLIKTGLKVAAKSAHS